MAVASFEHLCAGFCDIVKVPVPPLALDAQGLVACHVILRGVTVNLVLRPAVSSEHVFVVFDIGPVGAGDARSASHMQALLDANFALLLVHPPVFSRNPATGDAVLQYTYPLFEATPSGLYELIHSGIDRIDELRKDRTQRGSDPGDEPVPESPPFDMLLHVA